MRPVGGERKPRASLAGGGSSPPRAQAAATPCRERGGSARQRKSTAPTGDLERKRLRPRSQVQTALGRPRRRNRISAPAGRPETLQRRYMRLVLQHRFGQPAELDTAGRALCPNRRIELALDRSAQGLGFQHHDPRRRTNDVIELDRPSRTSENDIVKRGEADPL